MAKNHVADLIEEADKHRRLLGLKQQGSLQDTLPLVGIHFIKQQAPSVAAAVTHAVGLRRIGKALAEQREFVFGPATQSGLGIDPGVTQVVIAASQLPQSASSAGNSLEANLKHITVTLATGNAVWEVYLDPKWARQRLRLYGAQDRALEQLEAPSRAGGSPPGAPSLEPAV
ncbi:hypothetical protein HaLaN_12062 [Haematococcus lacustris]|uniref:Uncharacterized protein n=1 Tax=Haematococcus lacustris TaxID=44745 RepID=A0A699Z2A7_HAELA|nr:hypothetical protein HaLaN_12062 [Haematococcus lacustris]